MIVAVNKGYYANENGDIFSVKKKLILGKSKNGYLRFSIRCNGYREVVFVHKFVAYLKYGDKMFEDNIEVRHFNGDSSDNSFENILLGTHSDNMQDISKIVRITKALIASKKVRAFDDDTVNEILNDRKFGMTYKDLCAKYDTSKSTLSYFFNHAYYSGLRELKE